MELLLFITLLIFILAATSQNKPGKQYTICETSPKDPVENGEVKLS